MIYIYIEMKPRMSSEILGARISFSPGRNIRNMARSALMDFGAVYKSQ